MPISNEAVGREGRVNITVSGGQSAETWGNVGLYVLSTPALVGLFEQAAMDAIHDFIGDDERTVGTSVNIDHLAATPVGEHLRVLATVASVEGRKVLFDLSAADEHQVIARGSHARVSVDRERFLSRISDR